MHNKHFIVRVATGASIIILIAILTFSSLFSVSLKWSGPYPSEIKEGNLEHLNNDILAPIQIVQTAPDQYYAIFSGFYTSYYDDYYFFGRSSNLKQWSSIVDIESIVPTNYHPNGNPRVLTPLSNGKIQLTNAVNFGEYIRIRYRVSLNGISWEQTKEAYLNLTLVGITDYDLYYGNIFVFQEGENTKYLLVEDSWSSSSHSERLIMGYIEEANETFIIENIEISNVDNGYVRQCILWKGKPTILYRTFLNDKDIIGIGIYDNSAWDYFEIDTDSNTYYELLVHEDKLHIVHDTVILENDQSIYSVEKEFLQISEVELNYQNTSWQIKNSETITHGIMPRVVSVIENCEDKVIMVTEYDDIGWYIEEFDKNQLYDYITRITFLILTIVVPIIIYKIRQKNKRRRSE